MPEATASPALVLRGKPGTASTRSAFVRFSTGFEIRLFEPVTVVNVVVIGLP
jgi:hypothetical protein